MMRRMSIAALSMAAALAAPAASRADSLFATGVSYNQFVFGNATASNVDSAGAVAVGGNATFSNYAATTNFSGTQVGLTVGGNLMFANGTIDGGARVGGTVNDTSNGFAQSNNTVYVGNLAGSTFPSYDASHYAQATAANGGAIASNFFSSQAAYSVAQSSNLGATAGATVTPVYGGLTFTSTGTGLDVFHVSAANLAAANSITINAPASATVVIDVDRNATGATTYSMPNVGTTFVGVTEQNLLYNFWQATSSDTVSLSSVHGSILAPLAAVNSGYEQFDGELIAGSYNGNAEFHTLDNGSPDGFAGTLPSGSSPNLSPGVVPEPASIVLTSLAGLTGLGVLGYRRRAAAR